MKPQRVSRIFVLLAGLLLVSSHVWALSSTCAAKEGGTGIGGTGMIAKGTGIGGTGTKQGGGMALAGKITFSSGQLAASNGGSLRMLAKGDPVCVGDTLQTANGAVAHVRMEDGGIIQMRQNTRLAIEIFNYKGVQDGKERSVIALLQGGFRAVTGAVGELHKENYSIHTDNATIGIRGTDHEVYFIPAGQAATEGPGTYDHVISGGTTLQNEFGKILIGPDQTGYLPLRDAAPVLLDITPELFGNRDLEYGHGDDRLERESGSDSRSHDSPERIERHEHQERPETHERPEMMERPEGLEVPEISDMH